MRTSRNLGPLCLCALGVMLALVAGLGVAVTASATVGRLDLALVGGVHAAAVQPVTDWILALTTLGGAHTVGLVSALAIVVLAGLRRWHGAVTLALAVATTQLAVSLIKAFVERPRPPAGDALAQAHGYSFPSGHAAVSVALYATLALLCASACRGVARGAILLAGVLLVLGVGASRVYLGVHYPLDVAAGWLTGALFALASWAAVSRLRGSRISLART